MFYPSSVQVQFCLKMVCVESLIVFAVLVLSVLYLLTKYFYSYWKNKGVPHDPPTFPFGNGQGIGTKLSFPDVLERGYLRFKNESPFYGVYLLVSPAAVITDLDLIKNILIKDFNYFTDRGEFHNEKDDPLSAHMFAVDGPQWRFLRTKLSPTFTSGKMKFMFPTIINVGHEFEETLSQMVEKESVVEMKEILARFTTDVIGTCAFGIECNSLKDPNAEFRTKGRQIFTKQRHNIIIKAFMINYPNLARKFRMKIIPDDISEFFLKAVRDTVKFREENNVHRNDFMDLLVDIKRENQDGKAMSVDQLAAQAFVFFLAGFETSSTTMVFCLYEIAQNLHVQEKIREEINEVLERHNGEFTYEAMKDMTYMDQVINETLRKYPALPILLRTPVQDYAVPGTKYVIDKNTRTFIPVRAIHNDPEYYPDPEVFDPDRFSAENSKSRHSSAFLPFGDGPRNCIGLRFGKMQTRVGLVLLLKKFRFSTCDATQIPLEFDLNNFLPTPVSGISLKVEKV